MVEFWHLFFHCWIEQLRTRLVWDSSNQYRRNPKIDVDPRRSAESRFLASPWRHFPRASWVSAQGSLTCWLSELGLASPLAQGSTGKKTAQEIAHPVLAGTRRPPAPRSYLVLGLAKCVKSHAVDLEPVTPRLQIIVVVTPSQQHCFQQDLQDPPGDGCSSCLSYYPSINF